MESPKPPPGLTLLTREGKPYRFDPGALCLELLTTGGPGAYARWEVLHRPEDLVDWVGRSRLPGGLELTVEQADVRRARTLRDALFLLTVDRAHGRPLRPEHVAVVNAAAAEAAARRPRRGGRHPRLGSRCHGGAAAVDGRAGRDRPVHRTVRRPCAGMRRRRLPAALRRHLAPGPPSLVRDGTLRQPREGQGAPRPAGARHGVRRHDRGAERGRKRG